MTAAARAAILRGRLFGIVVIVLGGLLTHGTYAGTGDEPHYLAIGHSLAFDHDLDLSNNYGADEPLIADGGLSPDLHVRPGTGDVIRPVHDIGMPLLFAPYIRVMVPVVSWAARRISPAVMHRLRVTPSVLYRHAIGAVMILLAALLARQMFDAFMLIGIAPPTAFWIALLVALSPPLLIYGILFFTELPSALLCLSVFRHIGLEQNRGFRNWALAGLAVGMLFLIHVRNAGLVVGLTALALQGMRRPGRSRDLVAFLMSLTAVILVRTAVNYHMWGAWLTTPHARVGESENWMTQLATAGGRLAGMLVDQEFGLLTYAPVFALAFVGIIVLARTERPLAWRILLVVGCYMLPIVLPITNVHGWTGGWSPAARFLVPVVPLLAIGVAAGLPVTPRLLLVPLVTLQIVIDAYAWQHPKNLWNDGDGVAAICSRGGASVCRFLPSFAQSK